MKKVIIIGSGPSGISASLYTARANIDTTIISKGIGSLSYAHTIANYYGQKSIDGKQLYENGIEQAKELGVNFIDDEIVDISFSNDCYKLTGKNATYECEYLVIATGTSRKTLKIEGLTEHEGKGVSYCAVCDGFFYKNENIAVIGNGEFAKNEAKHCLSFAKKVYVLTDGKEIEFDNIQSFEIIDKKINSIEGKNFVEKIIFEDGSNIDVNGIFVALGTASAVDYAKKLGIEIENNKILVDENCQTSLAKLYAIGDCTGGLLQISKAVYQGAIAGTHISKQIQK